MQIIQKDISWLTTRVPDFMDFYNNHKYMFVNGYMAGGFLRKAVIMGSIKKAYEAIAVQDRRGDIDFFYNTQTDCTNAVDATYTKFGVTEGRSPIPNSAAGFAWEIFETRHLNRVYSSAKYQFIYRNTGDVFTVLNKFDISNCKIASDGKAVYMVEDWEELEKNRIIRIDNFAGRYLILRLKKYLSNNPYEDGTKYTLTPANRDELLIRLLETTKEMPESVRSLIYQFPSLISDNDLTMFYGMLGQIPASEKDGDYEGSSLSELEDFAYHMYKRNLEKSIAA